MSYLTMGDFAGTAQDEYAACRVKNPADLQGPAALTYADPCWQPLVGMRRAEGRDPFGRDLWGAAGAPGPSQVDPTLASRQRELGQEQIKPQAIMLVAPGVDQWGYQTQSLQDRLAATYGMPVQPTIPNIIQQRREPRREPLALSVPAAADNKLMYLAAGALAVLLIVKASK